MKKLLLFLPILLGLISCYEEPENIIPLPPPYIFTFQVDSALNERGTRSLPKDKAGYYHIKLSEYSFQTFSRITGKFLWNGKPNPIPSPVDVRIEWMSSHNWLLTNQSGVFTVYKTYFNEFTGKLMTVELGTLKASSNQMIPTVNSSSYPSSSNRRRRNTDSSYPSSSNGSINTIFAPIYPMKGDTIVVTATAHIIKEIPTSNLFVRLEREKLQRNIRFICE